MPGLDMDIDRLEKVVRMTGERALLDAKVNGTSIVYYDPERQTIVRHYPNGYIETVRGAGEVD
ncbi:hypothetical protein [Natribacillus halophilus]|uniref:Uncharacterized protein n=1 Tax=Natribacillus halophilus TaxID=549003 RepID=A0A1G8JVL2_9BACI|nr:hypothetical protein [Natribacillus halophilus]SDI35266.1 hypothetical protein SAMN04488123_101420 [Natribacillus halophilus]